MYFDNCIHHQGNLVYQKKYIHVTIDDCFRDVLRPARSQGFTMQNVPTVHRQALAVTCDLRLVVFVKESCPCTSTACVCLICSCLTQPGLLI